jgi:uncharacterized protein YbjQ (UPF0145 family)
MLATIGALRKIHPRPIARHQTRLPHLGHAVIVLLMDMENTLENFIVTTMNDLPGYEITQVLGETFGLVVRARNLFSNIGAGFRTLFGGEVKGYTQLLADSRNQAIERLKLEAMERGANAIIAMRFDCNELAGLMSEIAAYGTAVIVRKK